MRLLLPQRVNGGPTMPVRLESVRSQNSHRLTKAKLILAIKLRKRETSHKRSSASVTDCKIHGAKGNANPHTKARLSAMLTRALVPMRQNRPVQIVGGLTKHVLPPSRSFSAKPQPQTQLAMLSAE